MEIELRLKELLIEHGVNPKARGLVKELADFLDVHRHTARKLLLGNVPDSDTKRVNTVSLRTLGELCDWLHRTHRVPMSRLPHDLFGFGPPPELWRAVASMGNTTLLLGECVHNQGNGPVSLWVSTRDNWVANAVVEQLSRVKGESPQGANEIHTKYVPFRFRFHTDTEDEETRRKHNAERARVAKKMFSDSHATRSNSAHIYIGSQEVNGMLEVWIATLFGCKPFKPATRKANTPFYVWFRHPKSSVQSCFGGVVPPPGYTGKGGPGIYYRKADGRWLGCPYEKNKKDTGLVITYRDSGANIVDVAIFGLSGKATAAMADYVVPNTKCFYPPTLTWQGCSLGVYVCKFGVTAARDKNSRTFHIKDFKVEPIEDKVLKQFLQPRKGRKPVPAQ